MIVLEYIYKKIIAIVKESCSMIEKKEIWIFLSHSSEDFNKVRKIRNYLEEKSYRPLMFYLKCLESDEEIYDLRNSIKIYRNETYRKHYHGQYF